MNIRKFSLPAAILSAALLPMSALVACSDDSSNSSAVDEPIGDIPGNPDIVNLGKTPVPMMSVIMGLGMPWLTIIFVILMTFAVLTSAAGTVIPSNPDIGDGQIIEVPEAKDTTFLAPDEPAPEGGYTGTLTGVCEKGPLKAGSDVKLTFLDDALSPTGKSVSAKVADDYGKYTLQYTGMTSYAMLEATGAFLNDIMGDASA